MLYKCKKSEKTNKLLLLLRITNKICNENKFLLFFCKEQFFKGDICIIFVIIYKNLTKLFLCIEINLVALAIIRMFCGNMQRYAVLIEFEYLW